ncbi:hypothetical protein CHRYSEOSP005_26070 [Chryseobacterium sp. Alg-005]|uniref:outer membrane beta-barrel protein n=1 Tax=Chryseobacterium sp. Alg-005 TaxID=3159516 RepID=UPI0035556FF5
MFLRKAAFLLLIILSHFSSAQRKKKNDTVYVYEKVIVYDTIFLEKPIKARFDDIIFPTLAITDKIIPQNPKLKRARISSRKSIPKTTFHYGTEAGIGFKNSIWTQKLSGDNQQFGENVGVWAAKDIIDTPLSVMLNFNVYHWNSTFDLNANEDVTSLKGYHYTENSELLLFQRFNNRHFEYALHAKLFYEWKSIYPYAGVSINKNTYKMQFLIPEADGGSHSEDFRTRQINLGFSFGVQYRILKKVLLTADYQQYKLKNISLKNSSFDFDVFNTNNTFAERKINLGVSYMISR